MSNLIMRPLGKMVYGLVLISLIGFTTVGTAEGRGTTSLPAIIDLILTEDSNLAKVTLFSDSLSSDDGWSFRTDGVSTSDDEFDSARSEIVKGLLNVSASQEYGCPGASAQKSFLQQEDITNIALQLEISSTFITSGGNGNIQFIYNEILVGISLDSLTNNENGFDINDGTLIVTYKDGAITGTLDQIEISSDNFNLKAIEPNELASIGFTTSACGSDGYHDGSIRIDSIEVFTLTES